MYCINVEAKNNTKDRHVAILYIFTHFDLAQ